MLKDKDSPMEIDRAKAVSQVAQVIIESAKVECEHIKLTGQVGSGFIPDAKQIPGTPDFPRLVKGASQP